MEKPSAGVVAVFGHEVEAHVAQELEPKITQADASAKLMRRNYSMKTPWWTRLTPNESRHINVQMAQLLEDVAAISCVRNDQGMLSPKQPAQVAGGLHTPLNFEDTLVQIAPS